MITLASVNLNKGLRTTGRRANLEKWLHASGVEVLLAQEPSKLPPGDWPELAGYRFLGGSPGVAAWIAKALAVDPLDDCDFFQRVPLGYAAGFNVYLDAYTQEARADQLRVLARAVEREGGRPIVILGDFNLAPDLHDGLLGGSPSTFNSDVDRAPFRDLLCAGRLVDALAAARSGFTIERTIAGTTSQFRCDLALLSDYWLRDVACSYDHSTRLGEARFTDHSAVLVTLPIDLDVVECSPPEQLSMCLGGEDDCSRRPLPATACSPHKTAMTRQGGSPVAQAVVRHLLPNVPVASILDFGCGRGADVEFYRETGIAADGYDPYEGFGWDSSPSGSYDLITVVFVLNVLPDPYQRLKALCGAAAHLKPDGRMLVVTRSPREIDTQAQRGSWPRHNDGYWSHRAKGTFQKGISAGELADLAASAGLEVDPLGSLVSLGPEAAHVLLRRTRSAAA